MADKFFTKSQMPPSIIEHKHIVALNNYGAELINLLGTKGEPGNAISKEASSVLVEIQNVEQFLNKHIQ